MDTNLLYYWLATVNGIGARKGAEIISYFGSIQNAWNGECEEFKKIGGITAMLAKKIVDRRNESRLLKEISDIKAKGVNIITIGNEEYPLKLKNIYDPPYVLFTKGNLKNCRKNIAIVGSRKCTPYGRTVARKISKLLSEYDIGIISGLARGIDTEAHMGALSGSGFTCAVLGCGCDIVYPPENKKLMLEIEQKGALVSEYPPNTRPFPLNFPARNRIISGLSDGVLIVEAGEKSGALITASFALEQGRDVYAVPGSINSSTSKGTNNLIKDGAKLVSDVSDVLFEMDIDIGTVQNNYNNGFNFSTKEKFLMSIVDDSPVLIDDLLQKVNLKIAELNGLLTIMELKGAIKILPGRYIVRTF